MAFGVEFGMHKKNHRIFMSCGLVFYYVLQIFLSANWHTFGILTAF